MQLFSTTEILQIHKNKPSKACLRAVDFLGQLAQKCGASVWVEPNFPHTANSFTGRGKIIGPSNNEMSPFDWAKGNANRILLIANTTEEIPELDQTDDIAAVVIQMEPWQSEATLWAQSGLATILGDPEREPLVPVGNYSSATIAYAGFAALSAVYCKLKRFNQFDTAQISGVAALAWANWKSIAAGQMGKILKREGKQAEWPAIVCKDGYISFIFHVMLWDNIVKMIGEERLKEERFSSFKGREENREAYMSIIREWAATKTKDEIKELFFEHGIPGAPIADINEVLKDPLFLYRNAFEEISEGEKVFQSPVAPHRIPRLEPSHISTQKVGSSKENLPLSGIRILDLGIITAGAGSSAVLADMGAEVLKIESATYADPFRRWAGSSDSPLFKFNNRNKYGVEVDLKTEEGKARFTALVKTADVVLENFRRGVLDRIGFSFDVLREINPTIVLASISGQGLDGPLATGPTFGSTLEANAGFSALSMYEDGLPYVTGRNGNYPDQTVCLYASAAIALAVQKSKTENCALHIDVSQRDVAMYMIGDVLEWVSQTGEADKAAIQKALIENSIHQFLATADNRWVMISANCLDDFRAVDELEGITNLNEVLTWAKSKRAEELIAILPPLGIGAAIDLDGKEVYEKTSVMEKEAFAKTPEGIFVKGFPFQLRKTPMKVWGESPAVGEHTNQFI